MSEQTVERTRYPFSVSVCMPAYNEEANLPGMIGDVVAVMGERFDDFEIVVTNDGSKDDTWNVLQELARQYPQLKPVNHEVNQGYGAAVFTALSNASKDVIFFTDSDRQFKLEEIDLLAARLGEAEMVVGYRSPRRDPFTRVLFGHGWSSLVTLLFGYTARHRLRLQASASSQLQRGSALHQLAAARPSAPSGWCSPSGPATGSPRCRSATCRAAPVPRPVRAPTSSSAPSPSCGSSACACGRKRRRLRRRCCLINARVGRITFGELRIPKA